MTALPDPRPARTLSPEHPLAASLDAWARAQSAGERVEALTRLAHQVRRLLLRGDDASIRAAVEHTAPGAQAAALTTAIDKAINGTGGDSDLAVLARVFVLPILFVTGGKTPARVEGAIPDIAAVNALLQEAGALGAIENFGLGNALGSMEAAEAVALPDLLDVVRSLDGAKASALLAPAPIDVATADEQVHLRFLAGASITPSDLPTFLERAGQVGRWGMALSQLLARQLGEPGLSLLPLPRAPQPWFAGLEAGRFAREEIALNLFATGAIRRIRSETGDPSAEITATDDGHVRIDLVSPLDPLQRHGHVWQLGPADDLTRVELTIRDLLRDCRLEKVAVHAEIRPALPTANPAPFTLLRH